MKPYTSILAILLACGSAQAAVTATTTPVGYVSATVAGATGSVAGYTWIATPLVQATTFAGQLVSWSTTSGHTTFTFSGNVPTTLGAESLVEVATGDANEGWWSTVVSSTATTITVNSAAPVSLSQTANVSVRPHTTLSSFLGANAPGLAPGLDLTADEVAVLDGSTQLSNSYFYSTAALGAPADGWYDGSGNPSDSVVIEPGYSVLVLKKGAGNSTFTTSGTVKTTKTQIDIYHGDNWVSPGNPVGTTLAALNLDTGSTATGVLEGSDLTTDTFVLTDLTQLSNSYFAADPVATGGYTGWFDGGGNPAGTVAVGPSTGAVIKRVYSGSAVWTVPAVTVAP